MKITRSDDLYFLRGEPEDDGIEGFYLVKKEYWDELHCVDDSEIDVSDVLPMWSGWDTAGFCQEMESYFCYYDANPPLDDDHGGPIANFEKGLEILRSLGIEEVTM